LICFFFSPSACVQAILSACLEVAGHDSGFTNVLIDAFLRRGLLSSSAAASHVCSPAALGKLATDVHVFSTAEIAVDRSVEAALSLIAKRKQLIGSGVSMEDDAALSAGPKDMTGAVTHVMAMGQADSAAAATSASSGDKRKLDDEDNGGDGAAERDGEEEEEEDERGARRRRLNEEDDAGGPSAVAVTRSEAARDASASLLVKVNESLLLALDDCRSTYGKLVSSLLVGIHSREKELKELPSEDEAAALLDPWTMSAVSLLRLILRSYHSAQDAIISGGNDDYKVCDVDVVQFEIRGLTLSPQMSAVWLHYCESK
jgi:hypothetical protein